MTIAANPVRPVPFGQASGAGLERFTTPRFIRWRLAPVEAQKYPNHEDAVFGSGYKPDCNLAKS